jgi:RNA polymerase sigma-70 factor (ECF subfamily)
MAAIARGESTALGELYDAHAPALLGFATRAVGRAEAEDIVQTTFITAARMAHTWDGRTPSARAWLFGITARHVKERQRAGSRFARALLGLATEPPRVGKSPSGDRLDASAALQKLPEAKRLVLVLAEIEGFSGEEIAKMLDIPLNTVWTRLHHARRAMRELLEVSP